jgi:hypothetical protein
VYVLVAPDGEAPDRVSFCVFSFCHDEARVRVAVFHYWGYQGRELCIVAAIDFTLTSDADGVDKWMLQNVIQLEREKFTE